MKERGKNIVCKQFWRKPITYPKPISHNEGVTNEAAMCAQGYLLSVTALAKGQFHVGNLPLKYKLATAMGKPDGGGGGGPESADTAVYEVLGQQWQITCNPGSQQAEAGDPWSQLIAKGAEAASSDPSSIRKVERE